MAAIVTSPLQVLAVLCLVVLGIQSQIMTLGKCPKIKGSADFNILDYLGVWYEAQSYWSFLGIAEECPAIEFGLLVNGKILIEKHHINLLDLQKTYYYAAKVDNQVPYRFHWNIPRDNPVSTLQTDIVYTDYTDYAIVRSCKNRLFHHDEFVWITTRQRVASAKTIEAARMKMQELGLNTRGLIYVDQSKCRDVTPTLSDNIFPPEPTIYLPEYQKI